MQLRRSVAPALIVAGSLALSSPALFAQSPTANEEALRRRIEDLEQKLRRFEERLEQQARQQASQPPPPSASTAPPEPKPHEQALQQRVEEIDQQVKVIGRKQELEREAAEAKAKEAASVFAGREGVGLKSADGAIQLKFGAHLQVDSRWYESIPSPTSQHDGFLVRRARPIMEATLYDKIGLRLVPDFAGSTTQLMDAYIDAKLDPRLRIRAGKFKAPVGLELLQYDADYLFVERGFPTQLVPSRDVGVQLWGNLFRGTLTYQVGVFDGAVDGTSVDTDSNNGKDFAARLFAEPFNNTEIGPLRGLGLGVAYTSGNQIGNATTANLPRYLTPGQNTFFSYAAGAFADGSRNRYVPQLYYSWGALGLLGEYAVSRQAVTRASNHREVANSAWELTASYVLTGEDASYTGVIPRHAFAPSEGAWGAFEILARVGELDVDEDAFVGTSATRLADPAAQARRAKDCGIGLNWYLSRVYRVTVDYVQTTFTGGAPNGGNRPDEKVLFTRFQFALY
jgi:phosphate-selective porin OprO/OprP